MDELRAHGPLGAPGAARRVLPFAVVACLTVVGLWVPPHPPRLTEAAGLGVLIVLASLVSPWRRLPRGAQAVPPLLILVPVVLLRGPTGTGMTGFGILAFLPVLWLGLYAGRRAVASCVVGVGVVFVIPLLRSGGGSATDWGLVALAVGLSGLVGGSVHRLVADLGRRHLDAFRIARRLEGVLGAATGYAVIGTDLLGRIEVFNAGAERMLGWRADQVVGRSCELLHDRTELAVRSARLGVTPLEALTVSLEGAETERSSWNYVRRDGTALLVELSVTALRDGDGAVIGYLTVAEDVTKRIASEQRLRDSEANLSAVARVVRRVQAGQDARDAVVAGAMEAAGAHGVFLFEPAGPRSLRLVRSLGGSLAEATLSFDDTSATVATYLSGERLFVADPHGHPLISQQLLRQVDVAAVLFEPVVRRGEVVAVLVVAWGSAVQSPQDRKASVIALLAAEAAVVFEHSDLMRRLEEMASTDPLTGLANRRAWDEALALAVSRAARDGAPLTVAMLDLDHFKSYNDALGHQAGDELLAEFAAAASGVLRDVDVLARWGGEEFVVALPGCDVVAAADVLGRLRGTVPHRQTCSVGYAQWDGTESTEALVARADAAMYAAKQAGRDRAVAADRRRCGDQSGPWDDAEEVRAVSA